MSVFPQSLRPNRHPISHIICKHTGHRRTGRAGYHTEMWLAWLAISLSFTILGKEENTRDTGQMMPTLRTEGLSKGD
ncbi:hypothetical protein N657DRAFT_646597 [Parathielavia appendiculata]|uniref:Uncharacterized protein n=1 Tax=Parathielavia appendiculata TaxID=2587402 RepID=A0AAN6Z2V0_9PEZI|nr:hypothetical protein N657DRAFT_646597 [Parathielavia appendiculata]